jgi:hypothetical protein
VAPDTSAMELFPLLADNEYPIAVVNDTNNLLGVIIKGLLLGALADSTQVKPPDAGRRNGIRNFARSRLNRCGPAMARSFRN